MLFHSYICPSSMVLALPRKLYDVSTTTCCSHYLGWEIDPACIQFVTQTFSSVPMGDVAEFDIECVVQHIEAKLQRQDHLAQTSPVSATTPREGTEGTSGWLFKHMLGYAGDRTPTSQTLPEHPH